MNKGLLIGCHSLEMFALSMRETNIKSLINNKIKHLKNESKRNSNRMANQ